MVKNVDTAGVLLCLLFNFIVVVAVSLYYLKNKQWNAGGSTEFE